MLPLEHPDGIHIAFDDHRLVANAGLLLPASLALRLGLAELVDRLCDVFSGAPLHSEPLHRLHSANQLRRDDREDADVLCGGVAPQNLITCDRGVRQVVPLQRYAEMGLHCGGQSGRRVRARLRRCGRRRQPTGHRQSQRGDRDKHEVQESWIQLRAR